jgi:hypothetical protein
VLAAVRWIREGVGGREGGSGGCAGPGFEESLADGLVSVARGDVQRRAADGRVAACGIGVGAKKQFDHVEAALRCGCVERGAPADHCILLAIDVCTAAISLSR